jgi:hypothetical protein
MIRVCTPFYGAICGQTVASVDALVNYARERGVEVQWVKAQCTDIHIGRAAAINDYKCHMVHQKLPAEISHYLMLDADIAFEPKDVFVLLSHRLDIVGGCYAYRQCPQSATAGWWRDRLLRGIVDRDRMPVLNKAGKVTFQVDWIGMGFTLIARHVLEQMEYPWFCPQVVRWRNGANVYADSTSDDIAFCMRAREAGFKVMLDPKCRVTHLFQEGGAMPRGKKMPVKAQQQNTPQVVKQSLSVDEGIMAISQMADEVDAGFGNFKLNCMNALRQLAAANKALEAQVAELKANQKTKKE